MKARKNKLPFLTAKVYLKDRFDISITDDEFIEKAYPIWRQLGNVVETYKSVIVIVPTTGSVDLPTDCELIKSVTTYDGIYDETDYHTDSSGSYYNSGFTTQDFSAPYQNNLPESAVFGDTIDYVNEGEYIHITAPGMIGRRIAIVYGTLSTDSDHLPLLNDKEVEAIALMMALRNAEKAMWQGQQGAVQKLNYIKPMAEHAMQAARCTEYINDDQLDRLLDVKFSSDRKSYGSRFKLN